MKNYLISQFGHPRGLVGRLVGWIMARSNLERNDWTLALLDVQPGDHVLEVGFGPGLLISNLAKATVDGFVAGIDHSELMVAQAGTRNAAAIRAGQVALRSGSVAALPYDEAVFDKVVTINTMHHWPEPIKGPMHELCRVLKPGGVLVITQQPRWAQTEDQVRAVADEMETLFDEAGFVNIQRAFKPLKPVAGICVWGVKPQEKHPDGNLR